MRKYILESQKKQLAVPKKNQFENDSWKLNSTVCGIDEVGRGCLAGPLISAAVILPVGTRYALLKDSKILSETERDKAYTWITKNCYYSIGIAHNRTIDEINIRQATLFTMKKALLNLLHTCPQLPSAILIDAMPLDMSNTQFHNIAIHSFIKGESRSSSIAAASIVAKVTRDRLMRSIDTLLPGYKFAEHKGYGTTNHQNALRLYKPSIIHRTSFLGNFNHKQECDAQQQQSLC